VFYEKEIWAGMDVLKTEEGFAIETGENINEH
jgi:hypothetical protein